ncbi:MAG: DUF2339 domain-containing protein [Candidatus Hydrogenedentes bacterium]|nr:DUF2339 domain-containing protein [Candidatus Hydrogenedentota bacterium]
MHYDDELQALRRDLDDLLNRAAGLKNRIAAVEREIKLESISRAHAEPPVEPQAPAAQPPPLPPLPSTTPAKEAAIVIPTPSKVSAAESPSFTAAPEKPKAKEFQREAETALPRASVEERIWKYWMPRVASVVLAVGVAWALYYVGPLTTPLMRVGFGYAVSIALIGVGWWLEKKYLQYARVLYATAIGVSYFVSFAAHYISAARVIESESAGIGLLVTVVVAWGIVAQVRKSRIVATLVTMLGHLTMGLAFFTTGDLAKYSIAGVAILGFGSAFFLLYNRWYYVAVVGLVGCYLNDALWTLHFLDASPIPSFRLSFGFLWVYMLTFALAELFCGEDLRRSTIPTKFRTMFVTTNTVFFFVLATLTLLRYEDMYEAYRDDFLALYAVVLSLIGLGYLRLRKADPLYNAYLTKAVSAFTLFLAVRYGQGTLTASMAVESVALLYSSRRSGLVVTRVLAFGVAALSIAHGLFIVFTTWSVPYADPLYWRRVVESGLAVAALFAASQLYQRTDWSVRAPKTLPFSRSTIDSLWDLDLVAGPGTQGRKKPYGGLQFPFVYAMGGCILYYAYATMLVHDAHRVASFAAFVVVVTLAGCALQSRPFSLVAMLGLLPTVAGTILSTAGKDQTPHWLIAISVGTIVAAAVFADRRITGEREGLAFHQMRAAPYLLYCASALMLGVSVIAHAGTNVRAALYLAIAGAAATALVVALHRRAVATAAIMLLAFSTLSWLSEWKAVASGEWHLCAVAAAAACVFADRFFARGGEPALSPWGSAALVLSWPIAFRYVASLGTASAGAPIEGFGYFDSDWEPFALAMVSFAFAGYAALTRSRTAIALAALNGALVSFAAVTESYRAVDRPGTLPLVCAFAALAVFWALCEQMVAGSKSKKLEPFVDPLCGVCVGVASLLLVIMIERVPSLSANFLAISWGVLGMALFGAALLTWQRFYRYAALAVFLLGIARLFYDARNLEGIYRPLAFIGLAILMLIVSFGYYYASRLIDARKFNGNGDGDGAHDTAPPPVPPAPPPTP